MEGCGQVFKFGGMSVGSGERIRRVASVIGHLVSEGEGIVPEIVVSELPGGTDQLLRIARFACTGDHVSWQQELEALKRKHIESAENAVPTTHHPGRTSPGTGRIQATAYLGSASKRGKRASRQQL